MSFKFSPRSRGARRSFHVRDQEWNERLPSIFYLWGEDEEVDVLVHVLDSGIFNDQAQKQIEELSTVRRRW